MNTSTGCFYANSIECGWEPPAPRAYSVDWAYVPPKDIGLIIIFNARLRSAKYILIFNWCEGGENNFNDKE